MRFNNILFEVRNKIAFVTINRPDKLKALNDAAITKLKECFTSIKNEKRKPIF